MKCAKCKAPDQKFVTRSRETGEWTTSLNLAASRPQEYETPRKVILDMNGLCQVCATKGARR